MDRPHHYLTPELVPIGMGAQPTAHRWQFLRVVDGRRGARVCISQCRHCGKIHRSSDGRRRGVCGARQEYIGWVVNPRAMLEAQTAARLTEWSEADRDNVRASGFAQAPAPIDPTAKFQRPWWAVRRWNGGRD